MTWRLVICSRMLIAILLNAAAGLSLAGQVTGQVHLQEPNDSMKRKNDFSGVVVWLTQTENVRPHLVRKHVQMLQKDKKFTPHTLPIEIGTNVDFPNLDPIFHNAFSNFEGQIFDIGLYAPGSSRSIRFTRPGIVEVFCNIHPSMSAIIVVVDSSYFTVTDRSGVYLFPDVPAGAYQTHFFDERATSQTLEKLTQPIMVSGDRYELAVTTISEAGYLPVAHKNKYGRDYPPNSDGTDGYAIPIK